MSIQLLTSPHPLAPSEVVQSAHRGSPKGREFVSSWPVHPAPIRVVLPDDGWVWVGIWRETRGLDVAGSWRLSVDSPDIASDTRILTLIQSTHPSIEFVVTDGEEDVPVTWRTEKKCWYWGPVGTFNKIGFPVYPYYTDSQVMNVRP